jgi:hypothetical protein
MKSLLSVLGSFFLTLQVAAQEIDFIYFENWTNDQWQPSMRYDYSYDEDLFLINTLTRLYSSGNWDNYTQTSYSNNDNGSIHFYITQLWNQQGNDWDNSQKATYSYTEAGDPVQVIYQGWVSGSWQNSMNYIYNYDGNDLLIKLDIMIWNATSSSWQTSARYFYNNNSDSTLHDYLYQTYDAGAGGWSNQNRGTYTYSETKQLLTTYIEAWINNNWQNSMKQNNTYDNNDFLIHNLTQLWSQTMLSWQNNGQMIYENNPDGTVHQYVYQAWDTPANDWMNSMRATYTYLPPTGTMEMPAPEIAVYPNPAHEHLIIRLPGGLLFNLNVIDFQGKSVMNFHNIDNEMIINISKLPEGIYFLQLMNENRAITHRFLKY